MSDGIDEAIAKLKAVETMCAELGDQVFIQLDLPEFEAKKLEWLRLGGRDFMNVSNEMIEFVFGKVSTFITSQFDGNGSAPSAAEIFYVCGEAIREFVLLRFAGNGADEPFVSLSPLYLAFKRSRGKPDLIGVFSGALLQAFEVAPLRIVR